MQDKPVRMSDRNVLLGFKHLHRLIFSKNVKQFLYRSVEALRVLPAVVVTIFQDDRHMKVVRLSALRTGRLYPQEIILVFTYVIG